VTTSPAPVAPFIVVLSHPETPENIGFVARSMAAYGVAELRLVGIPEVASDSKAYWTTCGGEDILRNARYYPDVASAVADCVQAIGFTRRVRDRSQRLYDFTDALRRRDGLLEASHPHYDQLPVLSGARAEERSGVSGFPKTALVFGCESKGLLHEETLAMTHLVRIALAAGDMSLNLSHAVTVVLHDVTRPAIKTGPWSHPHAGPAATLEDSLEALEEFLDALDRTGYLGKGGKEGARREKVSVLWKRVRPTAREIDFMRGALKALAGVPSKRVAARNAPQDPATGRSGATPPLPQPHGLREEGPS
jgi:tRNA/rRNA methyltransferase